MPSLIQRVEELEARRPIVAPCDISAIGELATRKLFLLTPEMRDTGLSAWQAAIVTLASEGQTNRQAADDLEVHMDEFHYFRNGALRVLGTTNMAVGVDIAARKEVIPITVNRHADVLSKLTDHDKNTLRFFARGGTLEHLERAYRISSGRPLEYYRDYEKELFCKLGAWTRPHAIRRGHELDIIQSGRSKRLHQLRQRDRNHRANRGQAAS